MMSPPWDLPSGITSQQELLLKAALLPPEIALAKWNQWKDMAHFGEDWASRSEGLAETFETLDDDSSRLLPLVYRNLQQSGDPVITSLKGNYRFHLLKGKYLIQGVTRIVDALQNERFEVMLLRGVPLAVLYYQNMGLCPINDIDILILPSQVEKAVEFLRRDIGLKINDGQNASGKPGMSDVVYRTDAKSMELDLRACIYNLNEEAHQPMWHDKMPIMLGELSTFTLSPTHQLYHNFTHVYNRPMRKSPIRWVPDSLFILKKSAHEIKWADFFELAALQNMTVPVYAMLRYLKIHFDPDYPAEVMERIHVKNGSIMDQYCFKLSMQTRVWKADWFSKKISLVCGRY